MSGDDPDFLEFFAGEFWPLRRVGFLLTGDRDQAEELAQEAMARTWAAWPRVRGYDRPAAFARKVLLNRHRSLLRRAVVEARHRLAGRLGVPVGTVKSWTHRGLARLRERLGPTYADERLTGTTHPEAGA